MANGIRKSKQTVHVMYPSGDTADIISTILYADGKSAADTKQFAPHIAGATQYDTCRNIWKYIKQNFRYVRDAAGYEQVLSPGALAARGYGDCKSYSVFIGSCLQNLGIPYSYRFTKYNGQSDWTHVYVVAHTDTGDVFIDAVHTAFDEQVSYKAKKDINPAAAVSGIGALPGFNSSTSLWI